jgi:hypothetical protein
MLAGILMVCGIIFIVISVVGIIGTIIENIHSKDYDFAMEQRNNQMLNDARNRTVEIQKNKDIIFGSWDRIDAYKEFLTKIEEPFEIVKVYDELYNFTDDYKDLCWKEDIVVERGRKKIIEEAFNKWFEIKKFEEEQKDEQAATALVEKAMSSNKKFDLAEWTKQYTEKLKELPTTDIEQANTWVKEGKLVFMRPIHPGISNSEMGKESWDEFNYQIITENPGICWEFDYEERINQRGY